MTDEAATPDDEITEAPEGGGGGVGSSAHSPDPADQAQNVREATDSADDSSGNTDSVDAGDSESAEGSSDEATPAEGSDDGSTTADDATSADASDDEATSDGPAATPEPSPEGGGREAEQPSVSSSVPGADLEPIALEDHENLSAEERARLEAEAEEEQARREAELAAEKAEEDIPVREPAKLAKDARFRATGKRKSAIARVILKAGSGEITVNGQALETYFPRPLHQTMVRQPLVATGYTNSVEIQVRVHGGGTSGQASAVRHGVARALTEIDLELRGDLKRRGYLTRDARVKERRKAGFKKARKRPQFSKR